MVRINILLFLLIFSRDLRTGEFVAVKEIDLDGSDDCFDELRAEISTLMTCDHVNIIRYRGSYLPNITKNSRVSL